MSPSTKLRARRAAVDVVYDVLERVGEREREGKGREEEEGIYFFPQICA